MKLLAVTIRLELEVPDDWEIAKTADGMDVVRIGDNQFMDLTFEPMLADDPEGTWTDSADDTFMDRLLDMVASEDVAYALECLPGR